MQSVETLTRLFFTIKQKGAGAVARKYKRLRYEDRRTIEKMLKDGDSVVMIAGALGVHRDTIYKELNRSGTDQHTYTADVAQATL